MSFILVHLVTYKASCKLVFKIKLLAFTCKFIKFSSYCNLGTKSFKMENEDEVSSENSTSKGKTDIELDINSLKNIIIDKTPDVIITEGKAVVTFPHSNDVFYNPVQEFNRDLSVAVMKQFVITIPTTARGVYAKLRKKGEPIKVNVLEALAASGLRSIRYAKEVEGLASVVANDRSMQAYESMINNIKRNNVEHIVKPANEDAVFLMYKNKKQFDIIDLDPYGTPSIFLDAAIQSVVDGGLLMVTCTDMAVLCGNVIETCHAKYGAISAKTSYCHEMALRIVLKCIESHANKHARYIEPVLSISADFYIRLFVKVFSGASIAKTSVCKLSNVFICQGCHSFYLQPLAICCPTEKGSKYSSSALPVGQKCDNCNSNFKICGPIWSANLHDKDFVFDTLNLIKEEATQFNTSKRMLGMLNVVLEELDDCPLYHKMDKLCSKVHARSPTMIQFRSALLHAGYQVSLSHALSSSIKTNAPQHVIWDIVRTWARHNPGKNTFIVEPSKSIMSQKSSIEVSFELREDANPESRSNGLLRFQINPRPYWGPKARAKSGLTVDELAEKQIKHQGKRSKKGSTESLESNSQCKKIKNDDLSTSPCEDKADLPCT